MSRDAALPFDPIAEAERQWVAHGWSEAAEGMALVTSIMRVQQILNLRVDRVLRPLGLSFARYEVFMLLHFSREGELPLGKIGARLQVQPGAVTNAVDRLEADGLVVRRPHPVDGRTTLAVLSAEGRRLAVEATEELNEAVFGVTGLSSGRCRRLVSLLEEVRRDAGDF